QSSRLLIKIVILLFEYLVSVLTGAYLSENPLVSIKRYTLYLTLYLGVKVTRWRSRIQSQYLISPVGYICKHYFINKCGDTGSNFRPGHAAITPYLHGDVF